MARKSIGQFISALRKANGLTQQEVADRLNVSNKAVSRWERDESAPDISLIPALAELLGVTCDELLKGERITFVSHTEKSEPKIEKQLKALINRAISSFKTMIWIAIATSLLGVIWMFGISYGFYRPVIGFAVMLLFITAAFVITVIAVNKMKEAKADNELFEFADVSLVKKFNTALGRLSFTSFFIIFAIITVSLPLILSLFTTKFIYSVLTLKSYLSIFFIPVILGLALIFVKVREPYIARITGQIYTAHRDAAAIKMSTIQLSMTVISGILFVIAPFYDIPQQHSIIYDTMNITALCLLLSSIICFAVFILRHRGDLKILLRGIRNILMIPSALLLTGMHTVSFYSHSSITTGNTQFVREDHLHSEYLLLSLGIALAVELIFTLIEKHAFKNNPQ